MRNVNWDKKMRNEGLEVVEAFSGSAEEMIEEGHLVFGKSNSSRKDGRYTKFPVATIICSLTLDSRPLKQPTIADRRDWR